MIAEDYVSFEVAKLLKEKGFEGDTSCYYTQDSSKRWVYQHYHDFDKKDRIECPTLQMAMKWLREVHNTFISIIYENDGIFVTNLKSPLKGVDCMIDDKHNCWFTYEEACEAAIKYCLKNVI